MLPVVSGEGEDCSTVAKMQAPVLSVGLSCAHLPGGRVKVYVGVVLPTGCPTSEMVHRHKGPTVQGPAVEAVTISSWPG